MAVSCLEDALSRQKQKNNQRLANFKEVAKVVSTNMGIMFEEVCGVKKVGVVHKYCKNSGISVKIYYYSVYM